MSPSSTHLEDGNEGADVAEGDATGNEEALPLVDGSINHEIEDCGRDWPALGDPHPRLSRFPTNVPEKKLKKEAKRINMG